MRLQCPRSFARLALQGVVWCGVLSGTTSSQVRKSLLGGVDVSMLFIVANGIQRSHPEDAYDSAKYIHLLVVYFHQLRELALDVLHSPPNGAYCQPRRQRDRIVEPLTSYTFDVRVGLYFTSCGMAFLANSKYSASISIPILSRPHAIAAAIVDPDPMNGSTMMPFPIGSEARTICRMKLCGFKDGWGATVLSNPRAGDDWMRSRNGSSADRRASPPVIHFRRLSWTRPSHGLRNSPHGSQHERGITETCGNSS